MRSVRLFVLGFVVTLAAVQGLFAQAQASPVTLTFDNGRLSIGSVLNNRVILPADSSFPSPDLPTPQRTDIQLNGDLTDGKITIPAATNTGVQFPYMHLLHPDGSGLKIPLTIRLNEPGLTGTWDQATGAMTLEGKVDIVVVTGTGSTFPVPDSVDDLGTPPLGLFARCRINDLPVSFSTENQSPTTAERFTGGFGIHGALTAAWDTLPSSVSENGGTCDQLNVLLHVPGGLWLSNGVVDPKPQPVRKPTCKTDITLCPLQTFTEIDDVRLRPGRKAVKAGKRLILTVKVHNSGNRAANKVRVKLRSTNPGFRVPSTVKLNVPANGTASRRFVVKIKRQARGRGRIIATNNGWSGRAYLKVRG